MHNNKTKQRTEILPAVSAVIFNDRGEVLLQKRSDRKKWCIISGHVDFGESVEGAIIREVFEEISVKAEVVRLIGVYSSPNYTTYQLEGRKVQYVVSCFHVKLLEDVPDNFRSAESEEVSYFDVDRLPENFDLIHPSWLRDALDPQLNTYFR